jgi:hypothetical protein
MVAFLVFLGLVVCYCLFGLALWLAGQGVERLRSRR